MLKKGDTLDERYLIHSIIGHGNSSTVFRAIDLKADSADRTVKEVTGTDSELSAVITESSLMSELYSSSTKFNYIPNVIQKVKSNNSLYIIMEYINGWNLGSLIKNQAVPYSRLIDYAKDICTFISLLHQKNKIYCNMKPDSIMILKNDENSDRIKTSKHFSSIKFIDFSTVINKGEPSAGYTPEYAAPEQYSETAVPDERTDIFNIGACLYHMATGKIPLPVYQDEAVQKGIPRPSYERFVFTSGDTVNSGLKRIIQRCVNDDPKLRFQSCRSLYRELVSVAEHRHLKRSVLMLSLSVILAAGGIFSLHEYKVQSSNQFRYYMDNAKKSSSPDEKIENYERAIEIEPGNLDAYVELIDACSYSKSDDDPEASMFTSDEKTKVLRIIYKNKEQLIAEQKYEKVAFELGKLIWYHEDYGLTDNSDNKTTRMRDAAQYFEEAITTEGGTTLSRENLEMARTYYNIGTFYDNVIRNSSETDNEMYINFWNNLHSMMNFIVSSNSKNDLVCLETYRTALDALDSYSAHFRECGITYEEQIDFFELIKENAEKCTPDKTTKEIYSLKQNIQDRYDQCVLSVEMAFSSDSHGSEVSE